MRVKFEKARNGFLFTITNTQYDEIFYIIVGISGLQCSIEFPTINDDEQRVWVYLGFGLFKIACSFKTSKIYPDYYQGSGPRYGFNFFSDLLFIYYGQDQGISSDPKIAIRMPWSWNHVKHEILSSPINYNYTYVLNDGSIQNRIAKITEERNTWARWWIPFIMGKHYINVEFSQEIGERVGSWKGGCTGCSYEILTGESILDCIKRMEKERKF